MSPAMKRFSAALPAVPPLLLATALVALAPLACGRAAEPVPGRAAEAAARAAGPPIAVVTERVGGGADGTVEVPGTVEAARQADIASRLSAVVEKVAVEEGDFVKAGALLVRLDDRDLRARVASAESAFEAARAQRDRIAALIEKDAATKQEREAAEATFAAAQAERDAARAQIDYVEFRAPFDGYVVNRRTRAGDLALPGQPLLTLQGAGLLRVAASVTRAQAESLRPGDTVEAVLEGEAAVPATVSIVASAGDPGSLRVLVKADLPSGSGARAGSFARLRLPGGAEDVAPMVPRDALVERGALTGVYVVEDGHARLRWISPGEETGDRVIVRAGLTAGEEVIRRPGALTDGAAVERHP
jgi:RND family efflux transporter MFP subunit